MRTTFAAVLVLALAGSGYAGSEPPTAQRAPRSDAAPNPELGRPTTNPKPVDGKSLCTYVSPDPNAPSERVDCVAERDPAPAQPIEKTPPGAPGGGSQPSSVVR